MASEGVVPRSYGPITTTTMISTAIGTAMATATATTTATTIETATATAIETAIETATRISLIHSNPSVSSKNQSHDPTHQCDSPCKQSAAPSCPCSPNPFPRTKPCSNQQPPPLKGGANHETRAENLIHAAGIPCEGSTSPPAYTSSSITRHHDGSSETLAILQPRPDTTKPSAQPTTLTSLPSLTKCRIFQVLPSMPLLLR